MAASSVAADTPPSEGAAPPDAFHWTAGGRSRWATSTRNPLRNGGVLPPDFIQALEVGGMAAVLDQSFGLLKAFVEGLKPHKTDAGKEGVNFARLAVHRVACAALRLARLPHCVNASELVNDATAHLLLDHSGIFDLLAGTGSESSQTGADSVVPVRQSRCSVASLPIPSIAHHDEDERRNISSKLNDSRRRLFIGTEVMICIFLERQLVGHDSNWGSDTDAPRAVGGVRDPMLRGDFNALNELMNHFSCGLISVKTESEAAFLKDTLCPLYAPFIPKTIQRLCDSRIGAGNIEMDFTPRTFI